MLLTAQVLRIGNVAVLAAALLANSIAGRHIGRRSAGLDTDLTPAPPAFSIWFVIYALLAIAAAVQLKDTALRNALGPWLMLSLAATVAWLFAFTAGPVDARGRITPGRRWICAGLLVLAAATAGVVVARAPSPDPARPAQMLARAGLSLYAGWLAVATALGVLTAAAPVPAGSSGRFRPAGRMALWTVLIAPLAVASGWLRDPLLIAPAGWAALWRASRGDPTASLAGAFAWAAALAVR